MSLVALLLGLVASLVLRVWARRRQDRTGAPMRIFWPALGLVVVMPALVFAAVRRAAVLQFSNDGPL